MIRVAVRFTAAGNGARTGRTACLPAHRSDIAPFRRRSRRTRHALIGAFHAAHDRAELVAEFLRDLAPAHVLAAQGENPL